MSLSAREAAEQVGLSKQAVIKAIQRGQLSATKDRKGEWRIDAAELFRVWPAKSQPSTGDGSVDALVDATGDMASTSDVARLEAENEQLRERLADKNDVIADLRRRLDAEADERRRLTALLTVEDDSPSAPAAPWWRRLLGRKRDI